MKNSKGISLIALIITIIVIIILAAIVIGGVFNTPNDAKFANFCQQYDELQTAIQLRYYDLYQKYAIKSDTSTVPTRKDIYKQVALGTDVQQSGTADGWTEIASTAFGTGNNKFPTPALGTGGWFVRHKDGKLCYKGFQKSAGEVYLTPNKTGTAITSGVPATDLSL